MEVGVTGASQYPGAKKTQRENYDNGLKIQKWEWKFVKLLEQSDPRNPLSHMQFASYPQIPWPLHDVAASQVSIEWGKNIWGIIWLKIQIHNIYYRYRTKNLKRLPQALLF